MSAYNVISSASMINGQPEDVSVVKANFDAIAAVINALDDTNIAPTAGIALTKLASSGQIGASGVTIGSNSITMTNSGTIIIGDANLYRSAADELKTDDKLVVAGGSSSVGVEVTNNIYARNGSATRIKIGDVGTGSTAGIIFGSGDDTNLYRSAANVLKTDDEFRTLGRVIVKEGDATEVTISDGIAGLKFGTAQDTNIYRSAANSLSTDDNLLVSLNFTARLGGVAQVGVGAYGPSSEAGLVFGTALDTNLYRLAANTLKTDDNFLVGASGTTFVTGVGLGPTGYLQGVTAAAGSGVFYASVNADTNARYIVTADGSITWGSGAGAGDVSLSRTGINILSLAAGDYFSAGSGNVVIDAGGFITLQEIADPPAASANTGRLYVRDNGGGKSQLVARFPSGVVQVIVTEP